MGVQKIPVKPPRHFMSRTTPEEARRSALKNLAEISDEEDARLVAAALADTDNPPRRLGRPPLLAPKQAIKLRLDSEVIERFKAGGPGWQSRMNEALRKAVGL
jgi:uncharacterized protein (DUF4415 family)